MLSLFGYARAWQHSLRTRLGRQERGTVVKAPISTNTNMETIHIFEQCLGASGDANLLFAVNCSTEEAQNIEYEFKKSGQNDVMFRALTMFGTFEELQDSLKSAKLSRVSKLEKSSEFECDVSDFAETISLFQ